MRPLSYEHHGLEAIERNGPQLLFAEHHRSLRRAGENLMARAHEDDCFALVTEYRMFEKQILEHLRAEEEVVLPAYGQACPAEAAQIREAHAMIRKRLEATALDIELHAIRIDAIRELLALLDEHARFEDRTMYPWAQVHLPATSRTALGDRLIASLRQLAHLMTH
ncbi:MAG: hemerythrin domain-containing protein [Kofleriaceae bacterium]